MEQTIGIRSRKRNQKQFKNKKSISKKTQSIKNKRYKKQQTCKPAHMESAEKDSNINS